MKTHITMFALCTLVSSMFAQVPVKQDVLKILGDIPAPPATAAESFARITAGQTASKGELSAAALFANAESQLKAAEDAYRSQEAAVKSAVPPGVNPEMARMAQDPEFKKKMKSMSKEERMKLAMSMMSSAPAPGTSAVKPDPPEVQAALAEWQKLAADMQAEFNRGVAFQNSMIAAAEADRRAHDEISAWESAAIAKLPQISSGEMSAPDPAKVKVVRLQGADKHIAAANKRLAAFAKDWTSRHDHVRARYGAFSVKLIAADYASTSPNFSSQKILSDAQMTMLKDVAAVAQLSREAFESAASWVAHKHAVEQE
jgi:hypothetical protein